MKKFFKENGYFIKQLNPEQLSDNIEQDVQLIKQNFCHLPQDPYADKAFNRTRAYSNLVIFPWQRDLYWIPSEDKNGQDVSAYWQGSFNPEHQDAIRYFSPLHQMVKDSSLLQNLVWHDFDLTFWEKPYHNVPIYVGIHLVKLKVTEKNKKAISSPDLVHRDGEAFTFAHLFNRQNVNGGVNVIAAPECANQKLFDVPDSQIKTTFEMHQPFDSYGVCDTLVSHYVSPVEIGKDNENLGMREIILIDFSPMQQQLM